MKLKLGKTYLARNGREIRIIVERVDIDPSVRFTGDDGRSYPESGSFFNDPSNPDLQNELDLISEVK